jgi:rubrerythrin
MNGQTSLSESELVRLLQTGYVLEGIVEGRSDYHQRLPVIDSARMGAVWDLLEEAHVESREHRNRLQELIDSFDASCISPEVIERLVETRYARETVESVDDVLHDQLLGELSAYKFYDELLAAITESDTSFGVNHDELVTVLEEIRTEELEGVNETLSVMDTFDVSAQRNLERIEG